VPGFNDSDNELKGIAEFLAGISCDIPWHVSAYHTDYKMGAPDTPVESLIRAVEIGRETGLRYLYAANLAGRVGDWENTRCPGCGQTVIERRGYHIFHNGVTPDGLCSGCDTPIPGIWSL
jgi:pyruvate formate lyase activating enzyme